MNALVGFLITALAMCAWWFICGFIKGAKMSVKNKVMELGFRNWWWNVGSGIVPKENHDMEEHANRISEIAWNAAKSENVELLEQLKDYMASDESNSDGCEYSLVMTRVLQKAEELFKPNVLPEPHGERL